MGRSRRNTRKRDLVLSAILALGIGAGAPGGAPAAETVPAALQSLLVEASGPEASLYAERAHAPIWLADDGAAAQALIDALRAADAHALPPARYRPDALARRLADATGPSADPLTRAAVEIDLTHAFLRYARDVSFGLLDPRSVAAMIKRPSPDSDAAALLRAAAAAPDMAAHLAALAPADPDYARLKALYAELSAQTRRSGDAPRLTPGPTLRPGERGARVVELRARLAALGFDAAPEDDPARFDQRLAGALSDFQRASGLKPDAVLGPQTRAALDDDPAARAAQVAVNMERVRWLNFDLGARRIEVNQAAFTVRLIDGGEVLFDERVVVGTTANQTPEFSDHMEYMVLNPSWHVPSSIAVGEILPLLKEDPTYLARRNMRLVRTDGLPGPEDPSLHDFTGYGPGNFPYRIRQNPNDDNALGLVKFMFPNDHAIYLHDTPSKKLFARENRAFSHGCVRVRDPLRLAELLLAPQEADPGALVQRVLASGRERYVNLETHVPVHLLYRTVTFETGAPTFRADVYGRDARAVAALRAAGVALPEG